MSLRAGLLARGWDRPEIGLGSISSFVIYFVYHFDREMTGPKMIYSQNEFARIRFCDCEMTAWDLARMRTLADKDISR